MSGFQGILGGPTFRAGGNTAASTGTAITAHADAHTKGSYTELIASTTYPTSWVMVCIGTSANNGKFLVDIAVGAAASEQVVLSNLQNEAVNAGRGMVVYLFPFYIPTGSRIAARCQSDVGSNTCDVIVQGIAPTMAGAGGLNLVTTYGADTATSTGAEVDPGTTANTLGAWFEITASTTSPIRWLTIGIARNKIGVTADTFWLLDLAIGAAGSEEPILDKLPFLDDASADDLVPRSYSLPVNIPAGTRVAARCQCTATASNDRDLIVALYGAS